MPFYWLFCQYVSHWVAVHIELDAYARVRNNKRSSANVNAGIPLCIETFARLCKAR